MTSKSLKNQPVFFQPRLNPLVILFTHCWGQNDYDGKLAEGYQSTGAFGPWDSWDSEAEFPYKSLLSCRFSGLGIQEGQKMNSLLCFRMSRVSAGRLVGWRLDSIIWRLIYLHIEWLVLAIGLWPQSFSLWTSIQVWLGFLAAWQLYSLVLKVTEYHFCTMFITFITKPYPDSTRFWKSTWNQKCCSHFWELWPFIAYKL